MPPISKAIRWLVARVELGGIRTLVAVPMLKEDELIGAIAIYRQEVRPFTDQQIELVSNFAKQAVIAIEKRDCSTSCAESLQQQTATADVLKVISRSTFDLQACSIRLSNRQRGCARRICGVINRQHGEFFRMVATLRHAESSFCGHIIPLSGRGRSRADRSSKADRSPCDILAEPEFQAVTDAQDGGIRTMLGVPLLREGTPIGVIVLQRQEVRPFTDKQIELLRPSPTKPSSPSRIRGCSRSCARTIWRCSSRPQPRTCSRSSAARPGELEPSSDTLANGGATFAGRTSLAFCKDTRWLPRRRLPIAALLRRKASSIGASIRDVDQRAGRLLRRKALSMSRTFWRSRNHGARRLPS